MHDDITEANWTDRARRVTPAGVHSNARLFAAEAVFNRGDGPWLFDSDGERHADFMLGRGPAFLGHSPTVVNRAVAEAVADGLTLGQATELEITASERMLSVVPWADQVRFTSSGTEAVQAALRLARAATGRPTVIQFEGLYHGWLDGVSLEPGPSPTTSVPATLGQIPTSGAHTILLPWDDLSAVEAAFAANPGRIAAVITEPINIFGCRLPSPGFLAGLRSLTTEFGATLIFDEVVTGFRLAPGSVADLVGVTPDLATYAKAMGSGWPVSAVAGIGPMFEGVAEDRVRLSGTYNGNAAAMAAVIATIDELADGSVHATVADWGDRMADALVETCRDHGVPAHAETLPGAFWLVVDGVTRLESDDWAERLGQSLRGHRVVQYHHTWLTSAAHDDDVLEFTIDAVDRALSKLDSPTN